jgi:hypothetical protein
MIGALGGEAGKGERAGLHASEVEESGVEAARPPRFVEAETIGRPDQRLVQRIVERFIGDERSGGTAGGESEHQCEKAVGSDVAGGISALPHAQAGYSKGTE